MTFMDWINAPLWRRVRRIDLILFVAGLICVGYYTWTAGWLAGLQGGLLFVLMAMIGLWLL